MNVACSGLASAGFALHTVKISSTIGPCAVSILYDDFVHPMPCTSGGIAALHSASAGTILIRCRGAPDFESTGENGRPTPFTVRLKATPGAVIVVSKPVMMRPM